MSIVKLKSASVYTGGLVAIWKRPQIMTGGFDLVLQYRTTSVRVELQYAQETDMDQDYNTLLGMWEQSKQK